MSLFISPVSRILLLFASQTYVDLICCSRRLFHVPLCNWDYTLFVQIFCKVLPSPQVL